MPRRLPWKQPGPRLRGVEPFLLGTLIQEGRVAANSRGDSEVPAMFDPVLHHLHQAKQSAEWFAQLIRLDPELMLPAALPLVAARLMDAGGVDDEDEDADLEYAVI